MEHPADAISHPSETQPILPQDAGPRLEDLCRRFRVRELVLFGSANTDAFDPRTSDIDLIAEFEDVRPEEKVAQYFDLKEELERLFGRPVDVLTKAPIRNPYLRRSIERNSRRIFPRS